ncbi:MAG: hypothetical protein ISN29_09950 [Gammaproteobacteria bacterium AqS3]|nr:hypothetical protein [Gammaproteobacteria bacterium AqS3]
MQHEPPAANRSTSTAALLCGLLLVAPAIAPAQDDAAPADPALPLEVQAPAESKPAKKAPDPRQRFLNLRNRALAGQPVDFRALRLAWTDMPAYTPYSVADDQLLKFARQTQQNGFNRRCLTYTRELLDRAWIDYRVHHLAADCYAGIRERALSAVHRGIAEGLQKSIGQVGSGRSREKAWKIVDLGELHTYAEANEFRIDSTRLVDHAVRERYLVVVFRDALGGEYRRWFDISAIFIEQFSYLIDPAQERVDKEMRENYKAGRLGKIDVEADKPVITKESLKREPVEKLFSMPEEF